MALTRKSYERRANNNINFRAINKIVSNIQKKVKNIEPTINYNIANNNLQANNFKNVNFRIIK